MPGSNETVRFKVNAVDTTVQTFTSAVSSLAEFSVAQFGTPVRLDSTKINALLALVANIKFTRQVSEIGLAGVCVISDITSTDPVDQMRVNLVSASSTAANNMPAPHTAFKALSTGTNDNALAAAYLLMNSTSLLAVHNVRVVDLWRIDTAKGCWRPGRKMAGQLNSRRSTRRYRSRRERPGFQILSKFAAGLYSMVSWLQGALLSDPNQTVPLRRRVAGYIQSFTEGSAKGGHTPLTNTIFELEQARWLTQDEIEQFSVYKTFDDSWGSVDLPGTPCSNIGPDCFRELQQRLSAKNAPAEFNKGNRMVTYQRLKETIPALKASTRRGGSND